MPRGLGFLLLLLLVFSCTSGASFRRGPVGPSTGLELAPSERAVEQRESLRHVFYRNNEMPPTPTAEPPTPTPEPTSPPARAVVVATQAPTETPTDVPTPTPTASPSPTPTDTPTPTATPTETPSPTATPSPTTTPTRTPVLEPRPTATSEPFYVELERTSQRQPDLLLFGGFGSLALAIVAGLLLLWAGRSR